MVASWIYVLGPLIYGLPSIFLYLLSYFIIMSNRKSFDSSFFNLYVYDGIFNLLTYFNSFFSIRLASIICDTCFLSSSYKNINDILLKSSLVIGWHMAYIQYGTTLLISVNRFSVLLKYNILEPIWRDYTWILIVILFFVPFLDTYRYFTHDASMKYYEETKGYAAFTTLPISDSLAYLIPFMVISTICSVTVNVASLLFVKSVKLQKKSKVESNFLIIMSITCTAQLFGMILSVSNIIFIGTKLSIVVSQLLPFVSDGLTLVQPWLLVLFCHSIREKMKEIFGLKKSKVVVVSSQTLQPRSITN